MSARLLFQCCCSRPWGPFGQTMKSLREGRAEGSECLIFMSKVSLCKQYLACLDQLVSQLLKYIFTICSIIPFVHTLFHVGALVGKLKSLYIFRISENKRIINNAVISMVYLSLNLIYVVYCYILYYITIISYYCYIALLAF